MVEGDGIRQMGRPRKTWWDGVREDMKKLDCPERMQWTGTNGEGVKETTY